MFNVVKDAQVIATKATDADGSIIVPNVTEGMYAFFEVSVPAPYAKLQQPVIAHVDQATVDGGGHRHRHGGGSDASDPHHPQA